ncbi:MAG: DUF3078 domain-containing protein [Cytophagales bacterium]|nr:MAG: DUF3078 domain-containing protein [Cytophagales bacterium]TAF61951.1 MAG: DUF3078 domain-containing protein [Cytophagales bacterium]
MTKVILLSFASFWLCLITASAQSDTTYWTKSFQAGLNINQASFSDNWKAGGVNSLAVGLFAKGKASFLKGKTSWDNEMLLEYGMLRTKGTGFRKTADRILFDSKYGYKLSKNLNFYASLNFLSQFDNGFRYLKNSANLDSAVVISGLFAPAFLTQSIGFEYKPVPYFFARLGIGTLRQTIVSDKELYLTEPKNYGVEQGKTIRNEMACQLFIGFDKNVAKNINLKASYLLFANYEDLAAMDNRLDVVVAAKVNKYINTTLTAAMLYDQDQDFKVQYSQVLALGILVSL